MGRFNRVLMAAFLSAAVPFASAVAAMAADDPPPPKPAAPAASSKWAGKPFIIDNPDGTFTIQKVPKDPQDAKNGLVIPPQVVVPFASGIGKKSSGRKDAGGPCR